jgi:hypothetical protein
MSLHTQKQRHPLQLARTDRTKDQSQECQTVTSTLALEELVLGQVEDRQTNMSIPITLLLIENQFHSDHHLWVEIQMDQARVQRPTCPQSLRCKTKTD